MARESVGFRDTGRVEKRAVQSPRQDGEHEEAVELARRATGTELETLLFHRSRLVQEALLGNPSLGEPHLAVLLARKDLAREVVTRIAGNKAWMRSYPLKIAVLKHPHTPRHLALPLLKFIHLFDLLSISATAGVSPELKRLAEDAILAQREGLALGQRLSLARRAQQRVAGELLLDPDPRVASAALGNPALTESAVAGALFHERATEHLTQAVLSDARWFERHNVKLALLRSRYLSLARFASILPSLPLGDLKDLAADRRVRRNLRAYVSRLVQTRGLRMHQSKV